MQKFCGECGSPLEPGVKFCGECGTPVVVEVAPAEKHKIEETPAEEPVEVKEAAPVAESVMEAVGKPEADNQSPKKKNGCLIGCLIGFAVIVVLGIAIAVGGYFLFNKATDKIDGAITDVMVETEEELLSEDVVAPLLDDIAEDTVPEQSTVSSSEDNTVSDTEEISEGNKPFTDTHRVLDPDNISTAPMTIPEEVRSDTARKAVIRRHNTDGKDYETVAFVMLNVADIPDQLKDEMILWEFKQHVGRELVTEYPAMSFVETTPLNNAVVEYLGILLYFHGDTGEILWSDYGNVGASIAVTDDGLIVASSCGDNFLSGYNEKGNLMWRYHTDDKFYQPTYVSIHEESIYVTYAGGEASVFDLKGQYQYDTPITPVEEDDAANAGQEDVAVFKDPGFEKAIRDYYGYPSGDILLSTLLKEEELDLDDSPYLDEIRSLDDVAMFKNLKRLDIGGSEQRMQVESDTAFLMELNQLEYLSLSNMPLTGWLAHISAPNLEKLYIEATDVEGDTSDLTWLNLTNLGLSYSQFGGDVGNLAEIETLETIYIHSSRIYGDANPLLELPLLRRLHVSDTSISGDKAAFESKLEDFRYENSTVK